MKWPWPCLQGGFEDVGEHRRQLVSALLKGGRRVQPSCFAGVLPLEQSVDFSHHCGSGGVHLGVKG